MEDVAAASAARQAGKTARGRSDCHFRHPACVENRMPVARRSASLARAADLTRQRLDSGVLPTSKEAWTFEITISTRSRLTKLRWYFTRAHVEQAIRVAVP